MVFKLTCFLVASIQELQSNDHIEVILLFSATRYVKSEEHLLDTISRTHTKETSILKILTKFFKTMKI